MVSAGWSNVIDTGLWMGLVFGEGESLCFSLYGDSLEVALDHVLELYITITTIMSHYVLHWLQNLNLYCTVLHYTTLQFLSTLFWGIPWWEGSRGRIATLECGFSRLIKCDWYWSLNGTCLWWRGESLFFFVWWLTRSGFRPCPGIVYNNNNNNVTLCTALTTKS